MKKVNFFKVMSAVLAFSAMTLASCSEEKMTINGSDVNIPPFELPAAKATVSITVVDVETGKALGVTNKEVTPGTTVTVECPAYEDYIVAQAVDVEIPALVAGQVAVVPVTFFVASEGSAAVAILEQINEDNLVEVVEAEASKSSEVVTNESNKIIHKTFEGKVNTGIQFNGVAVAESRAAATGAEFIEEVFGLDEFKFGEKSVKFYEYWLNPWHQATLSYEQEMATATFEVEFNGETYEVTFTVAGAYVATMTDIKVIEEYKHNWEHVLTHGHAGHDYNHGNGNAGGGIVEGE